MNFHWFEAVRWDLPALMLGVLLLGFAWSLWATQRRPDFDFAEAYRDEANKVSAARVIAVGSWVVATWCVMQAALGGWLTPELFGIYCLSYSGSLVLSKAAEKWDGRVPFGKGS